MMFGAVWLETARDDLADVYVSTPAGAARDAVVSAAEELERQLRDNAPGVGESRGGMVRIGLLPPLAYLFEYNPEVRVAVVGRVWRYGR